MLSLRILKRKFRNTAFALTLLNIGALSNVATKAAVAQEQKVALAPLRLFAPSGEPVKNAVVSISYSNDKSYGSALGKTDAEGRLDFSQATPGGKWNLTLWVEGVGFANVKDFQFTPIPTAANSVRLQRGVDFEVRCVENTKPAKPLGNVTMMLQRLNVENGTIAIEELSGAESYYAQTRDGDGIGRFAAVPAGTYILKTGAADAFVPFAEAVEVNGTSEKTVVLNRESTASILLKVVDSENQPVVGRTFSLRTNYAAQGDSAQLFEKKRISVAEAVQWNRDFRAWFRGYPLPSRTFVTNEKGEATIYPIGSGCWQLALFSENSTSEDSISKEATVTAASGTTESVALQLKPDVN